jgi:hypothetical protein
MPLIHCQEGVFQSFLIEVSNYNTHIQARIRTRTCVLEVLLLKLIFEERILDIFCK